VRPIGILGGTFDPIHFGHLRPALDLYQELGLQGVRLIPCRQPPHRRPPLAGAEQRLAMLQAAIAGERGLSADTRELRRPGPSYTLDTLRSLRSELDTTPLCLIVGSDAFARLDTWHRWRELIVFAHLVVVQRPGCNPSTESAVAEALQARYITDPERLGEAAAGFVLRWPVTQMDISGTHLRALIAAGKSPRFLLPDSVWEFIQREGLYATADRDRAAGQQQRAEPAISGSR
jgi:nicotinate-nucleotide adenylyltransferase